MKKPGKLRKSLRGSDERGEIFFFGEHERSFDPQRRIAIPSGWRDRGGASRFVLLKGRHNAIQVISADYFAEIFAKIRKVSFADPVASKALAKLASTAEECECDAQGRISVPQQLMAYAGLGDQAVLVGALTTAQIYSRSNWEKIRDSRDDAEDPLDVLQKITERPDDLAEILKGKG